MCLFGNLLVTLTGGRDECRLTYDYVDRLTEGVFQDGIPTPPTPDIRLISRRSVVEGDDLIGEVEDFLCQDCLHR